jgi:hypothetical protein
MDGFGGSTVYVAEIPASKDIHGVPSKSTVTFVYNSS